MIERAVLHQYHRHPFDICISVMDHVVFCIPHKTARSHNISGKRCNGIHTGFLLKTAMTPSCIMLKPIPAVTKPSNKHSAIASKAGGVKKQDDINRYIANQ
jgi:hypothetical protein